VSERLGHATIAITIDTYSHVLPGLDEQAAGTGWPGSSWATPTTSRLVPLTNR
jgi:hypothetical protein